MVRSKQSYRSLARTVALLGACFILPAIGLSCPDQENYLQMAHLFVETDHDRTVDIRLNETVRITLPENATTGYRWTSDHYESGLFNELPSKADYPATTGIGSGGEVTFIFEAKSIGTGEIELKQWRSWEGDASVISRFKIRMHVVP